MTPSELKYHVENTKGERYFFTRDAMKFFGDTMKNYGVRAQPVDVTNHSGETVKCWELYRKRPVKHGLKDSAFFAVDDYRRVFKAK